MEFTKETENKFENMLIGNKADKYQIDAFKEFMHDMTSRYIEEFTSKQHKVSKEQFYAAQQAIILDNLGMAAKTRGAVIVTQINDDESAIIKRAARVTKPTNAKKFKMPDENQTKKAQILDILEQQFGSSKFRYKDLTIAALLVNNYITDPSEYTRKYRGYYSSAFTPWPSNNDYMFYPGRDGRYLEKHAAGVYTLGGKKKN